MDDRNGDEIKNYEVMDEPQMHRVRCGVPDEQEMIPTQIVSENFEQGSRVGFIQHDDLPGRPGESIDWPE